MLRNLLSGRVVLAGLVFFVVIVGSSLIYSWHVHRISEAELLRTQRSLLQLRNQQTLETLPQTQVTIKTERLDTVPEVVVSEDLPDASQPREKTDDAFRPAEKPIEAVPLEDVPVSPFGFGVYPELPPEWEGAFPPVSIKHELMVRVAVKLRQEGVDVDGTSMEDGWVFPNIRGTYYVKWAETDEGVQYISEGTGHPDDGNRLHVIRMAKGEPLTAKDIPTDITLVSYEEGRIDPYAYLGFQR